MRSLLLLSWAALCGCAAGARPTPTPPAKAQEQLDGEPERELRALFRAEKDAIRLSKNGRYAPTLQGAGFATQPSSRYTYYLGQ